MRSVPQILFVDDEPAVLRALRRLFADEPVEILMAESGEKALALIEQGAQPCVILSDQNMPHMKGSVFLAEAKARLPDSVRFMLTGYADLDAAVDAINQGGISRYLSKPWRDEEVLVAVRDAVQYHRLIVENRALTQELHERNRQLEDLNANLEGLVAMRTRTLEEKLKELEGRNILQEHLLTIHPLENTVEMVRYVIAGVMEIDVVRIYLLEESGDLAVFGDEDLSEEGARSGPACGLQKAVEDVVFLKKPVRSSDDYPMVVVPIVNGDDCMGAIEVNTCLCKRPLMENDVEVLCGFALQAAVGIRDSLLKGKLPPWDDRVEKMLDEFE
jgi:CheY-like chemotaxis protein